MFSPARTDSPTCSATCPVRGSVPPITSGSGFAACWPFACFLRMWASVCAVCACVHEGGRVDGWMGLCVHVSVRACVCIYICMCACVLSGCACVHERPANDETSDSGVGVACWPFACVFEYAGGCVCVGGCARVVASAAACVCSYVGEIVGGAWLGARGSEWVREHFAPRACIRNRASTKPNAQVHAHDAGGSHHTAFAKPSTSNGRRTPSRPAPGGPHRRRDFPLGLGIAAVSCLEPDRPGEELISCARRSSW